MPTFVDKTRKSAVMTAFFKPRKETLQSVFVHDEKQ